MKVNVITLGCSKNVVDSEHVAGHLRRAGIQVYFDREQTDCDVTIVNTCGFIGDAKEESVNVLLQQAAIKQRGRKPRRLIAVGCLIERYRKELAAEIPEIDAFYGTHQWGELVQLLTQQSVSNFEGARLLSTRPHYAYLKIAEGCNRRCAYCAIPSIRGHYVSRTERELVSEAHELVAGGVKELLVIAQDTTFYGRDWGGQSRIAQLMQQLAEQSEAEWIRLHYTYPTDFPMNLLEVMSQHPNICRYIDMPLQHISTPILASMQRGMDSDATRRLVDTLRERIPGVALRTTFIVGYPGETDREFEELKQFVCQARFERMGVFAYSPEEGTPAESLGDPVPQQVKQQRIDELMELQERIALEQNEALVGQTMRVLIDEEEDDHWVGRTEFDSPEVDNEVVVRSATPLEVGQFYDVRIATAWEHDLEGVVE
ncbi:MAG: 30S ribosomal protein S12 methylthiotransferase RimO [Bacteroidales bacterium]|nr:30S ribosomal protein S12 methylthiotransferase RimO [Bacteroidales bacterium]